MAFAEIIGDERRDVTLAGTVPAIGEDDGAIVLESAVSLCAAAAKKVTFIDYRQSILHFYTITMKYY